MTRATDGCSHYEPPRLAMGPTARTWVGSIINGLLTMNDLYNDTTKTVLINHYQWLLVILSLVFLVVN